MQDALARSEREAERLKAQMHDVSRIVQLTGGASDMVALRLRLQELADKAYKANSHSHQLAHTQDKVKL